MGVVNSVFGAFSWTPPPWFTRFGIRRAGSRLALLALAVAAAIAVWKTIDALPKPPRVVATAIAPGITPIIDNELVPERLFIDFSVDADPRRPQQTVHSVARIDLLEKILRKGIAIEPKIDGQWRWQSETRLVFTPASDWPAGETYRVRYDASIFAQDLDFERHDIEFKTADFAARLDELAFYQDPVNKSDRKIVATLTFTHPVDRVSLESVLSLRMRTADESISSSPQQVARNIEFDVHGRTAYVHSEQIEIPLHENFLTLTLAKKLAPASGPARFDQELIDTVLIPDIGSYFRVRKVESVIARDTEDEPQQTLVFEFTDQLQVEALTDKLKAWLLPAEGQLNGQRFSNKNWQSPREITTEILAQAERIELELNPTEREAAQIHSANIDVPEQRQLYLAIEKDLQSEAGFIMSVPFDTVVHTGRYPTEAKIAQSGAIVPLTGEQKLTFLSRGLRTLKVEVGRILESEVNHLASQSGGDIQSPWFQNYHFDQDNLTVRSTHFIDLRPDHPRKAAFSSLDLSEFLPDGGGYYFVTVQGWDRDKEHAIGSSDRRLVQVTDLGLIVKSNADSTHDVFVQAISSGNPVSDAAVTLLGKNGLPVFAGITSSDGHLRLPTTDGYDREKTPTVFVARVGSDSIFMPFNRGDRSLQYSRFDVGGEHVQRTANAEHLKAQMFSDRGIYRPGDTVNIAAIVKGDKWQPLEKLPMLLRIQDSRQQTVFEKNIRLPHSGFFDRSLDTTASFTTGEYHATLFLIDKDERHRSIGDTAFKVEEFLPDRLKIRSKIAGQKPLGWIKPGELFAEVTLENLFGTPAQARRVTGSLELRPTSINFPAYPDYVFVDPLRKAGSRLQTVVLPLTETTTDDDGLARLPLNVRQYDKGIYELSVSTEGFEAGGGRSVKSLARITMSPLDTLLGYKTETDLSWIDRDSTQHISLIALNSHAEAVDLDELTVALVEERYVSTLVRRANGTYAYQSILKSNTLSEQNFAVQAFGTRLPLPTENAGRFALVISDASDVVYARIRYTVAGGRNLAANLERNAELSLAIRGSNFEPGDTIEMEITAPYTGSGLITIERDRVYTYKWFRADTTTSVQTITVPDGLEGNAYVNVAFVREASSPEVFVSPLSYAVKPFAINGSARNIDIKLDSPELVRPGDELEIKFSASRASKIVIYAVDEGILQVANYTAPRPLAFFLPKMALQVGTFQMVDLILPEFTAFLRAAAPGGGGAAALIGKNLNPFQRKSEPAVAFWSGIIDAASAQQSITFDIPDYFNGRLRLMAIAVSNDAVGRQVEQTTVRGPFVVTPNLLTAAAPGDEFDVTVAVANNLEGSGTGAVIDLVAEASQHLEVLGDAITTLEIPEGDEGSATFRVRALEEFGNASLSFEARSGSERVRRTATMSVRPSVAYVSTMVAGSASTNVFDLPLERTLQLQFAKQTAAASTSPLVLADGMLEYLRVFPHACTEQIVSKVFPQLGFLSTSDPDIDRAAIRRAFADTVNKLRTRQLPEGGFRFWTSSQDAVEFPSIYLTHFLTDARTYDLPVPPAMLNSALDYLRRIAGRDAASIADARQRAYAIYVLTRNNHVTSSYLTKLHEYLEREHPAAWRADLTASYMAASYQLLKLESLANDLIKPYELGSGDEMTSDFDTRLGRDAQYVYLIAKHFPEKLPKIEAEDLQKIVAPIMRNRFNTLSAAYVVLALGAYTEAIGIVADSELGILGVLDDASESLASANGTVRAAFQQQFDTLRVNGGGNAQKFFLVTQSGYDREPPTDAAASGLELFREYLNAAGKPVVSAQIGDELTVRLRVRSTGRYRANVAVVDLLPGGFEVLRESVRDEYGSWYADYKDIREDRVVIYGGFSDRITEIHYRVKVTAAGNFIVPSAVAGSMYDREIEARTKPGRFDARPAQ